MSRFYMRLESMSRFLASTQRAAAATHRIFEILDRRASVAEPVEAGSPGPAAAARSSSATSRSNTATAPSFAM